MKNASNRKKHGLSFEEAAELFLSGVDYLELVDEAHSADEDRFIAVDPIGRGLILVVHVQQEEDVIRIISARWASKRERMLFVRHWKRIHE